MAASFSEECDRLLAQLEQDLRQLAVGKLRGDSNEDLAGQLTRSHSSVNSPAAYSITKIIAPHSNRVRT